MTKILPYIDDATMIRNGALIDEDLHDWHPDRAVIDGVRMGTGLKESAPAKFAMFADANEYPDELLLDEHDLKLAFEQQRADHATLYDLRMRPSTHHLLDSLNQTQHSLCWNFSTTKAIMCARALAGFIGPKLSGWWGAGKINHWKDEGGWGENSMLHAAKFGVPTDAQCPAFDRKYDTPENDRLALEHLVSEYFKTSNDKEKRTQQMLSHLAIGDGAGVIDLNWMSHSMASLYVSRYATMHDFDLDTDNSWGQSAGKDGTYRCKGPKARPDGYIICRVAKATAA